MYEIIYQEIEPKKEYEEITKRVIRRCLQEEKMEEEKWEISILFTTPSNIQKINQTYRGIDKATDVLSFPMFEKDELEKKIQNSQKEPADILGDIIISIEKVKEQAKEYGHSFERELSYMLVHGFYHLMGYDHIEEADKQQMRQKEEYVLGKLEIRN